MSTPTENKSQTNDCRASTDASFRLNTFYHLSNEFESIKKNLTSSGNYYTNRLFSLLGYNYEGKVENINILHLVSEAFLLGVFEELQKENKDKPEKLRYNELLSQINWIIVQENTFIDNMKILSGIYNLDNPTLNNAKVLKMFLVNLQSTKNDILKHHEHDLKDAKMTREKFDGILSEIFNTAYNYTLNEFNSSEEKKKSLSMYHLFSEIQEHHPESFNVRGYSDEYIKRKKLTDSEARETRPYLEYFFNYSLSSFDDLIEEVELFGKNSTNLLFKIKSLISYKNIRRTYEKYYELVTSYAEKGLKNVRLDAVLNFYKSVHGYLQQKSEMGLEKIRTNYQGLKKWIDNNQIYQDSRDFYFRAYENARKYTEIPRSFVYNNIYQPLRNVTVLVTEQGVRLVLDTSKWTKEQITQFKDTIVTTTENVLTGTKNLLFGEEALIKIHSDKDDYVSIELNKKLFIVDPEKTKELFKSILESIRNFSVTETTKSAYNGVAVRVNNVKTYLYESYRKFLELANEDEEEVSNSKKEN